MVAVRQESWFDGQRGEGLYGCRAYTGRQGRCPYGCYGLHDDHPALAVGADAGLPSLLLTDLLAGLFPAHLGQGCTSELLLHLAEPVAA